jgi:hypothetical protein
MARPVVRAVLALLVVATIAAFFVTQQLKSEDALVLRFAAQPKQFSPNGDGTRDGTLLGFDLSRPATVSFYVMDGEGNEIRRLVDDRALAGDAKHRFRWNGRDDDGRRVPDGLYRMRVIQRAEGRVIDSTKRVRVDRLPPRVALLEAAPGVIAPREPGQRPEVTVRYRGPRNTAPEFRVFRTDTGGEPRVVRRFRGSERRRGVWHGEVAAGPMRTEPAPDGDYAFTVTVRDKAGNPTVAPEEIPRPATARSGTGVSVRSFTLSGPLDVVPAGSAATLEVGPIDRSLDFVMSRYGDPEPIRRGGRIAGRFRVHVPGDARTGVYLVRVRAGRHRAVWPLAVAGLPPRRAADRPRPLVVLPTMSWQGLNPVDDDLDGFADTLPEGRSVGVRRPFRGGGLPPRFRAEVGPLLRYLDRERLAYDLTTDVSLARREGPSLGNAPGVAFAGSPLWLPETLMRRLRAEVADGLRVTIFGADALRRTVRLSGDRLSDPSGRRRVDAFGEGSSLLRTSNAPLSVFEDGLGLFDDLDAFFGDFTVFEESAGLPTEARSIAAAGRDPRRPAFVAYGIGGGMVIRSGTPQWAQELEEARLSEEVPAVTRRIWRLLRQGAR